MGRAGTSGSAGTARWVAAIAVQFAAVVYLTLVTSLVFWSRAPQLIGWQPRVVLTGSMLPVIQPGDVAVIGPAVVGPGTLPRGRVVLVRDPAMRSGFYLHRVLRYDESGRLITKGDANAVPDSDPVEPSAVIGQLRLVVPLIGRPVIWTSARDYLALALTGVATWASLTVVLGRRHPAHPQPS